LGFVRVVSNAKNRRRLGRSESHVETPQVQGQSLAPRLDIGFLAGPTGKECVSLSVRRQLSEHGNLALRKVEFRDFVEFDVMMKIFEINADLPVPSERVNCYAARM
jgi:hypothetical protein